MNNTILPYVFNKKKHKEKGKEINYEKGDNKIQEGKI